jgi:hypothetical protein
MRPELVQNIHIKRTVTGGCTLALTERLRSKDKVGFMRRVGRDEIDRGIVVFDPIKADRSRRVSRRIRTRVAPRWLVKRVAFVTAMDISTHA